MSELFGILAGLIVTAGAPSYLIDILKGKTKPQRVTWFIWSMLSIIAFISQLQLGAHWSLLYVGLSAIGALIVFGLSLKYGVGGWTWADKSALVLAAVGLAIALLARQPLIALFGVVLADFSGVVLTINKTYRSPSSETTITWLFLGIAASLTALAVGRWSFELLLYPVYSAVACFGVLLAKQLGAVHHRKTSRS